MSTSSVFTNTPLSAALWAIWSRVPADCKLRLAAIKEGVARLSVHERADVLNEVRRVDPELPVRIDDPTSPLGLEEVLLVIQYSLYGFDSAWSEMIIDKIKWFLSDSATDPELVDLIYPNVGVLGGPVSSIPQYGADSTHL